MNKFIRAILGLLLAYFPTFATAHHEPVRVTFLNPGYGDESFWGDVDRFMLAAAQRLDIVLEIFHGDRDVFQTLELGEKLAHSQSPSDFVILVNEKNTGPRLLNLLADSPSKIIFILNDLSEQQKAEFGRPRVEYPRWLGSLVPDNHWVGYHTARQIHEAMMQASPNQERFRWLAISGDQVTPASVQRQRGMLDYVHEHRDIELMNIVYGEWNEAQAYRLTRQLLSRSRDIDGLWVANDHMAFGAITALRESGLTPGKDVFVSAVNSSPKVLDYRQSGTVSSLGAGHFTAGGWALLLAYEYAHGIDAFADQQVMRQPLFDIIEPGSKTFRLLYQGAWDDLDFRRFSRVTNPAWQAYAFSLNQVLMDGTGLPE